MSISDRFSKRVSKHPRILAYAQSSLGPLVLVVRDQLLVSHSTTPHVLSRLAADGISATKITSLLAPLDLPKIDVDILTVKLPAPNDIVPIARRLRAEFGSANVSPNHVLVPAFFGHSCPYGPPSPIRHAPVLAPAVPPFQPVTVIDSGYQWDQAWGANPLLKFGGGALTESEADTLDSTDGWISGTPDVPDVDGDHRLDALAGHANFIAGVIAQHCPHARIAIRNHNGGFAPDSNDFPTEAAVARSIIMSQQETPAKVINVGFAFTALDDEISGVWAAAFELIGPDPLVVAPAGNQDVSFPYFPAALNTTYPGRFPNMIGVASILTAPGVAPVRSSFSNYGPWVTCAANGEAVESTFLHVRMRVEDDSSLIPRVQDFTKNSWASWNGTSFATPKVVAAIASQIASSGAEPYAAWQALATAPTGPLPIDPDVGIMFTF
jgi:thermitase